jgi:hypothetical protein
LAHLDARKRLFSPFVAARDAAYASAAGTAGRAALPRWPERLASWLLGGSGACAAACVAGCCAELVGLLHRHWQLQHWHRLPFDAVTNPGQPHALAAAAARAEAAARAASTRAAEACRTAAAAPTAAAEAAAEAAAATSRASFATRFSVGERVEAKDFGEQEEWEEGTVTALEAGDDGRQVPRVIKDGCTARTCLDS